MVFDKERIYEKISGYDAEGDSRVVTELIRRFVKKSINIRSMNILKRYGGWDINGQNKKSFVEKNYCFVYDC